MFPNITNVIFAYISDLKAERIAWINITFAIYIQSSSYFRTRKGIFIKRLFSSYICHEIFLDILNLIFPYLLWGGGNIPPQSSFFSYALTEARPFPLQIFPCPQLNSSKRTRDLLREKPLYFIFLLPSFVVLCSSYYHNNFQKNMTFLAIIFSQ